MNKKILFTTLCLTITGCQSQSSFHIPLFNEVVNYEEKEINKSQEQKDAMYYIMLGGIELNRGKTQKAINYYERSLALSPNNKIAFTLLDIYYNQNDIDNVKKIHSIIKENNIIKNDAKEQNILISLLDNNYQETSNLINDYLNSNTSYDLKAMDKNTKKFNKVAEMLSFTNTKLNDFKEHLSNDSFILINFYTIYNNSIKSSKNADEAITYMLDNINKVNVYHHFSLFKIGYLENYDSRIYKESLIALTAYINDYQFDMNTLQTLRTHDLDQYNNFKKKFIERYKEKANFWYVLGNLEYGINKQESLSYFQKSYSVLKKTGEKDLSYDKVLSRIIYDMINLKKYDIQEYITLYSNESLKKEAYLYLVIHQIENDIFSEHLIEQFKSILKRTDLYILSSKAYSYLEEFNESLYYIDKAQEINPDSVEVNLNKLIILSELNPDVALDESKKYYQTNKSIESELLVYSLWASKKINTDKGITRTLKIYNNLKNEKFIIDEFKTLPIYLLSEFYYQKKDYSLAEEYIKQLPIDQNYAYLADYGKILWKLNKKEEAIEKFEKSKLIRESNYLEKILNELNIKLQVKK